MQFTLHNTNTKPARYVGTSTNQYETEVRLYARVPVFNISSVYILYQFTLTQYLVSN